jgi:hypothetical protein
VSADGACAFRSLGVYMRAYDTSAMRDHAEESKQHPEHEREHDLLYVEGALGEIRDKSGDDCRQDEAAVAPVSVRLLTVACGLGAPSLTGFRRDGTPQCFPAPRSENRRGREQDGQRR